MTRNILEELRERGLVAQVSDETALVAHLATQRTLYCGFDPTAESLHIGNLVPLLALRRFQARGHRPILLVGGATGLIGDPSGRNDERSLNAPEVVAGWVERIQGQVGRFLDFEGNCAARVVNNLDWTANLSVISFLREIGKHFSVNAMIHRESVRSRLEREGEGISYTEFSYMLLQAMDYLHLAETYGCTLQIGGSDQWGNIVSGMDLVRRKLHRESFALTLPLVTKADGSKFGKSAGGAVWLDATKTSPYSFYQFWFNAGDADAGNFLRLFTFLEVPEIDEIMERHRQDPGARDAQRRLAAEVTRMVHGESGLRSAERITAALFEGGIADLDRDDLAQLALDGMDRTEVSEPSIGVLEALARSGLAQSNGAARKLVAGGGVRLNGVELTDAERRLDWSDALFGRYYLVRRGKKNWHLLVRAAG
ncbi:MAG: tyrosine--tRNA ligase [Pseudomonadales bacterium]|nr:tyrosine--tRNA ligase [Pseudomonadales bacterium]